MKNSQLFGSTALMTGLLAVAFIVVNADDEAAAEDVARSPAAIINQCEVSGELKMVDDELLITLSAQNNGDTDCDDSACSTYTCIPLPSGATAVTQPSTLPGSA